MSPPPKQNVSTSRPRPHASSNGHSTGVGGGGGVGDFFGNNTFFKQNTNTTTTVTNNGGGGGGVGGNKRGISGADLFGMDDFTNSNNMMINPSEQDLENAIGFLDKRLLEMKVRII